MYFVSIWHALCPIISEGASAKKFPNEKDLFGIKKERL